MIAPVMTAVRIAAVFKVYELHGGKGANRSPVLHLLQEELSCSTLSYNCTLPGTAR